MGIKCLNLLIVFFAILHNIAAEQAPVSLSFKDKNLIAAIPHRFLDVINANQQNQKSEAITNLFKSFPRLILPFNPNKTSEFTEILTAAENHSRGMTTEVEVWISLSTFQNNSSLKLLETLNELQSGSPEHRTITSILLDYNGVSLGETEKMPNSTQISEMRKALNHTKYSFGLIADLKHCNSIGPLHNIDIVLFNDTFSTALRIENYLKCYEHQNVENSKVNFGFISKWPVSKDQGMVPKFILGKESILSESIPWNRNVTTVLDLHEPDTKPTLESTADKETIDGDWLKNPIVFNKLNLGVSIKNSVVKKHYPGSNGKDPHIMKNLYDTFINIILGDVNVVQDDDLDYLKQFVKTTAIRKQAFVRNRSQNLGVDIFDDQNQMNVLVSTKGSLNSSEETLRAIDVAREVTHHSNTINPETISMIVVNFEHFKAENTSIDGNLRALWNNTIRPGISRITNDLKLNATVIFSLDICPYFNASRLSSTGVDGARVIMFQKGVSVDKIKSKPKQFTTQLKTEFESCQALLAPLIRQKFTKVQFRVKPSNCGDDSYNDLDGLATIARIWEEMNTWAKAGNTTVFMDTAFDDPDEGEFCGWWNERRTTNDSNPTANNTYENKKEAAYKLYDKLPRGGEVNILLVAILSTMAFVVVVTAVVSFLVMRRGSRNILGKEESDAFFKGLDRQALMCGSVVNVRGDDGSCNAVSQPYDKEKLEIPEDKYSFDITDNLGSGEYGQVYRGKIKLKDSKQDVPVAVKMINDRKFGTSDSKSALKGILSEIKILSYIGKHPNIILLEGASTPDLRRGKVLVFLELCEKGSLEKHLSTYQPAKPRKSEGGDSNENSQQSRNRKNSFPLVDSGYVNIDRRNVLDDALAQDMLRWSQEICNGMEFLTAKKVVHADLATRNVLLNTWKTAKIADFGLSRRLYDYTNYVKKKQEPLPWRWMSPESLRRWEFNEKTDIWAFGITLWEIYTLGEKPYPGMQWDSTFCTLLDQGLRPEKPFYNEINIHKVMETCWEISPSKRPTFSMLKATLAQIAAQPPPNYVNIQASF